MSDQPKITDQVEEGRNADDPLEKAPDVQAVRHASGEEKDAVLAANPNQTQGVTELAYKDGFVDDPSKRSIELVAFDKNGNEVRIDKTSRTKQKDISLDPHPTRVIPAMTAEAEAMIKAKKQRGSESASKTDGGKEVIADTGTLKAVAENASLPEEKRILAEQYQEMRTASKALGVGTDVIDNLASEVLASELTAVKGGDALETFTEATDNEVVAWDPRDLLKLNPEKALFPHRGEEDRLIDYLAARQAFKAAHLDQYRHVSPELIAAVIRNEQHFYKKTDEDQDQQVRVNGTVRKSDRSEDTTASIGPAQMQIGKIRELVSAVDEKTGQPKYPFLQDLKGDPIRAAEDPGNAALLTAAYLAHSAERLKPLNIEVNNRTLAYTWNPDVFLTDGRYECPGAVQLKLERQLPAQLRPHRKAVWNPSNAAILSASMHVKNVERQLRLIQERERKYAH